ncbi:hypothetical protein N9N00_03585 [Schleiferiaceae bacterium]|nr:hypothetical protein [Schleiferiaceae bacterium]
MAAKRKVLYALQGTGNGHVARARELVPLITQIPGVELHLWISGTQSELNVGVPVDRRFNGLTFYYSKRGGIHWPRTLLRNTWGGFLWDVLRAPVERYEIILNDFEPISAWAAWLKGAPLWACSHQYAVMHSGSPRPKNRNEAFERSMFWLAPYRRGIGFHFDSYAPGIYPPIIRSEIRHQIQQARHALLVYLPAYHPKVLLPILQELNLPIYAFFKGNFSPYTLGQIEVRSISNEAFMEAFRRVDSVLCGAGFELPTEALFHGKRLAVVPIQHQYEQSCNGAAAQLYGAWLFTKLKKKHAPKLKRWLSSPLPTARKWPDQSLTLMTQLIHGEFEVQEPLNRNHHPRELGWD